MKAWLVPLLCATAPLVGPAVPSQAAPLKAGSLQDGDARLRRDQAFVARIERALADGSADPAADALAALRQGRHGLITAGDGARGGHRVPGARCFTPYGAVPEQAARIWHGDALDEAVMRLLGYAEAYNRALLDLPGYRDADLCRPLTPEDRSRRAPLAALNEPARTVTGPPGSLHEAARRGTAAEVRDWLASVPVEARDGLGMTALGWAVARGNGAAVEVLLAAGADPWSAGGATGDAPVPHSAVYWSIRFGRSDWFDRLAAAPGRRFDAWPPGYVAAAAEGGDIEIVRHMLANAQPDFRFQLFVEELPPAAVLEPVLARYPEQVDELLGIALRQFAMRPDLARLALANGADPNRMEAYETPLAHAAGSFGPEGPEIVDMLLRADADPDRLSHWTRPIWIAVRGLPLASGDIRRWKLAIVERLLRADADLTLPDKHGRPPAWALFFPVVHSPDELDAKAVSPELLALLVRHGLDLNVPRDGKRLLAAVEAQAGMDSELARTLRAVGARR